MRLSQPLLHRLGIILFSAGVLLAFVLTTLMTWADIEAVSYGFPQLGNDPMRGLSCPLLMNRAEGSRFTVTLENTADRALRPVLQTYISSPSLERWRTTSRPVDLQPGERKTLAWDLGAGDVVLGSFVFVKAYTAAAYPMPNTEGICGSFVVDIPRISGNALFWIWLAAALALLALGLWIVESRQMLYSEKAGYIQVRRALALLSVVGLFTGYAGMWVVSVIVLLLIILILPTLLVIANY